MRVQRCRPADLVYRLARLRDLHLTNPFFSPAVWSPKGTNLLVNASSPLIGAVLAPVTWLWGPVASTNLALTLAPGVSSWACFIACRRFVSWRWAALLGGVCFGYSPFVFSSIRQGHLGLGLLVIPPLVVVLLDEIVSKQKLRPWIAGLILGSLVVVQFFISPEVLVMMVVIAVVGLSVAAMLAGVSWYREKALSAASSFGVAAAVAAAFLAVPAWFALAGPDHIAGAVWPNINLFGNNVNDLWDPDSLASAGAASFGPLGQNVANLGFTGPNPSYIGLGALVIALLAMIFAYRRKVTWVLLASTLASFALSLGSAGLRHDTLASFSWLPWQSIVNWPLLDDVLPGRFALLTDLSVVLIVTVGLDEARNRLLQRRALSNEGPTSNSPAAPKSRDLPLRKFGPPTLFVTAVIICVPMWRTYSVPTAMEKVDVPPWFSKAALAVPSGSVVLTYPFPASASLASEPMVWQALDAMHFKLAGGYVKVPGPDSHPLTAGSPGSATNSLDLLTLVKQTPEALWVPSPAEILALRDALSEWKVSYIVVTPTGQNPVYAAAVMTAVSGHPPVVANRAWVWDLRQERVTDASTPKSASTALGSCRSTSGLFEQVAAGSPLPQKADLCVSLALAAQRQR